LLISLNSDERPEILVTTPDAVMDYLHGRPNGLHRCSFAVVDNVDSLVEMNLEYQLKTIANHLRGSGERQILLMGSAWNVRVETFARQILNKECVRVIVGPISKSP
jgi:superfamily II DNA/RNA helicase